MYLSFKTIVAAGAVFAVLSAVEVQAADSACKGLAEDSCKTQGCSWVKAYKTTKGKDVSAFCRKKPERKSSSAASAPKG
jgi:hypothetical protein